MGLTHHDVFVTSIVSITREQIRNGSATPSVVERLEMVEMVVIESSLSSTDDSVTCFLCT